MLLVYNKFFFLLIFNKNIILMKIMMMIFVMSIILSSQASEIDVNTWSNYQEVTLDHLSLEWLLDLPNKFINGTAEYTFTF